MFKTYMSIQNINVLPLGSKFRSDHNLPLNIFAMQLQSVLTFYLKEIFFKQLNYSKSFSIYISFLSEIVRKY